jgi:iron complex transport system ATP-binding protein
MNLIHRLNRELGKTIVLVVHDLNLAARYADYLIALKDGKIVASGEPAAVMTTDTLRHVFDVETHIVRDEVRQILFCVPLNRSTSP